MVCQVVGSTGLIGRLLLLRLLADHGVTKVVSVSRRATGIVHPKLHEIIVEDFSRLADRKDQLNGDAYFCCLGTTIKSAGSPEAFRQVDQNAVLEWGRLAKSHNAKVFLVISALGADPRSTIFYNKVKGETEAQLGSLGLRRLIIFRPGLLLGQRQEKRWGEGLAIRFVRGIQAVLPNSLIRRFATDAHHLAEQMLRRARQLGPSVEIIEAKDI